MASNQLIYISRLSIMQSLIYLKHGNSSMPFGIMMSGFLATSTGSTFKAG